MFGYSLLNKIPSCQTATATRTAEKAIGLISKKKKRYLCPSSTLFCTFLCRCFARPWLCSYLHVLWRFMEEIPYVLTCSWPVRGCFCRCYCFLFFLSFFFFTAAHYNLGGCLFSHRAARKLSCSSSNEIYNSFAAFISRSSSLFCYQRQCRY